MYNTNYIWLLEQDIECRDKVIHYLERQSSRDYSMIFDLKARVTELQLEIGKLKIELEIAKLEVKNPDLAKIRKLREDVI